jgi:N-acyl-D-amino-acid deacylase
MAGPDLLLRGGTLVDGTGSPARQADVLVSGRLIAAVGPGLRAPEGARVLDVGGLTVAPGFIDLHSHSDFTFPAFPDSPGQVSQGVTSELVGHCGDTPAPIAADPGRRQQLIDYELGAGPDLDWSWGGFASYMDVLDASRPAVNCLPLVGHNALRIFALGMAERRPSPAEIASMREALREGLAAGAWGMSTGLAYAPGQWAETDDIVAVAEPLKAFDGIYASHIRNESDEVVAAVAEALSIGERVGVPVEVSHLKAAGARNFGRTREALALIAEARGRGWTATCDMYPYEAGSTYLSQLFPPWVFDGGTDAMLERIRHQEVRARIRADVERGLPSWGNLLGAAGSWDRVLVNGVVEPGAAWAKGRSVSDLAAGRGVDPLDLTCDLLLADRGATTMAIFMLSLEDVREVLASPMSGVGSDLYAVTSAGAANHPRCSGSFARLLRWSREGLLPLEEAVRKLTSLPASTIGLRDRGRIEPGLVADLAAFDAQTVTDNATWEHASALASGVEHVLIGGEPAVERGRPVNLRLGRVLRRPQRA